MTSKRRVDPEARPGELLSAARTVFSKKGVANSSVSDIVKAAGAAKGTFYLYFTSKEAIIHAVVEQMSNEMVDAAERAVAEIESGAVYKFIALLDAMITFAEDPIGRELAEVVHQPGNRAIYDRLSEQLMRRLVPTVESIIEKGKEDGIFDVEDVNAAAWFILGGLHSLDFVFDGRSKNATINDSIRLVLRTLGYNRISQGQS